jgi:hypothetical protein
MARDLRLIEPAGEEEEKHDPKEHRPGNPHRRAAELLVHDGRNRQEPPANGVDRKPVALRERKGR